MKFGGIFLACMGANFLTLSFLTFAIYGLYGWYKRNQLKKNEEMLKKLMKGE